MTDEIKPALTVEPPLHEQLRAYFAANPGRHTAEWRNTLAHDLIENTGTIIGREQTVVVAHTLLPDDSPYKITRDDVKSLRDVAHYLDDSAEIATIAAKLAALLPPEPPKAPARDPEFEIDPGIKIDPRLTAVTLQYAAPWEPHYPIVVSHWVAFEYVGDSRELCVTFVMGDGKQRKFRIARSVLLAELQSEGVAWRFKTPTGERPAAPHEVEAVAVRLAKPLLRAQLEREERQPT